MILNMVAMDEVEPDRVEAIPARLARRPIHPEMGIPIPAFADLTHAGLTGISLNAVPPATILRFAEARWCWICGEPVALSEDVWLVGDEDSYLLQFYPEPGGHEECVVAALALCPYIFNEKFKRATERRLGQPRMLENDEKPDVWVIARTRYYKVQRGDPIGVLPRSLSGARFFAYEKERLVEVSRDEANAILDAAGMRQIPPA